jgi:hypothetical protein
LREVLARTALVEAQRVDVGRGAHAVAHAHRLHGTVHDALVERLQVGRHLGHALGDAEHLGVEVVGGECPVGEPGLDRLVAAHRVTGEHRLHRPPHAHEPHVPGHVGRAHATHGRVPDLGVVGDVHEVARRRELGAAGQAEAVHLGDDRRGQIHHLEPALQHVPRPSAVGGGLRPGQRLGAVLGEVVPGGEARPCAADDDHAHVGVGVGRTQRCEQFGAERVRQCVALGGSVEGEPPHHRCGVVREHQCVSQWISCPPSRGHAAPAC